MNTIDDQHHTALATAGWTVLPGLIRRELLDSLVKALGPSLALRDQIRRRNGVQENSAGTLHHLLMDDPCYVELLAELSTLEPVFKGYFQGNFVLNSYGGVINERDSRSYVQNVHRDIRFGSDSRRFMVNALVMLDDFTLANGATHILSHSQNLQQQPTDEHFYAQASRATGERGSVLLFDSRMWHATGRNTTDTHGCSDTATSTAATPGCARCSASTPGCLSPSMSFTCRWSSGSINADRIDDHEQRLRRRSERSSRTSLRL
jgi:hypothetical protein